eukprot:gene21810-26738_t
MWENDKNPPPFSPQDFMAFFVWFYVIFGAVALVAGILNLLSGRFLQTRKHRMFSMVTAGLNCLQMPLGTVLGVFTLVVLNRDSTKHLLSRDVVLGAFGFALVSLLAFSIWAFAGKWFSGEIPMYIAIAAVFLVLSGVVLGPLAGGAGRFYRAFLP